MLNGSITPFGSIRFVESEHMVKTIEDWSRVRSPSRAARRLRQGHRQNIVIKTVPRMDAISTDGVTFILHPAAADLLRRELKKRAWDTRPGQMW